MIDIWENSIRARHLFLTSKEIDKIKEYVPKAIENVECKAKEVKSEDGSKTQSQENQEVSTPTQTVKISSVTVETNGVNYGMPETLEPFNYMKWLYSLYGMEYKE